MLKVDALYKNFSDKKVLRGINFTVPSGQIAGLVGKNGAGKTTIFHSILNFVGFEGEITFDGKKLTEKHYSQIGYLPEERSLMPKLTVFEQVRFLANLKGVSTKEVQKRLGEWLERLQVKGKPEDKIKSLSKGNQQKIQLICTLLHNPKLIILDEPFSGLDPINTDLLKQVILDEKKRGATIIFSDHDMTNVEEVCDDLIMISNGKVVLNGDIQAVRNSFGLTRIFVRSDWTKEQLAGLPHVRRVSQTKSGSYRLELDDEKYGTELFETITKGEYVQTFDQQPPTLNEIFKIKAGENK
ncbi:ABC transporter, ATP-binding protein [Liquorilactobacillus aquaticus DSM 21051]|uniref:ABC transporter, ATP-binding protein n=1 Tax=Liquorilactobacillus aquaticus DSM 21051 TaxID=1423725 RepID=A0A0R2D104_9LACO|nr:ABC transporter ATP-binding protein [Liquorilactobacillus aquaticus]KRM97381.1 ABC transporter, ATP-binding protein [Liquorilactobacillus aquaticus DSM 21051]